MKHNKKTGLNIIGKSAAVRGGVVEGGKPRVEAREKETNSML